MECAQCKRKSCGIHCDIWIKSMNSEGKGRSVGRSDKLKSMNSEGKGRSVGRSDKLKSMNSEGKGRSDKLKSMNSEGKGQSVGRSVGRLLGVPKLMKYRLLGPKCRVYTLRKGFIT